MFQSEFYKDKDIVTGFQIIMGILSYIFEQFKSMFSFLQKKIAVPANSLAYSCGWDHFEGWLAIGASEGFLKLIRLEDPRQKQTQKTASESADLTNHEASVKLINWNHKYRKLTSCDSSGLIVVFMKHNGEWIDEMVNNRKMSVVVDLKWSPDGTKICIAYEDGHVIVGGVQGSRKWGKDFTKNIRHIAWAPDSRLLIVGTKQGELHVYDENGQHLRQLKMSGLKGIVQNQQFLSPGLALAGIDWYQQSNILNDDSPVGLCVAYEQGRMILMKNDKDDDPIAVDTSMILSKIKWNPSGTIIAVAGCSLEYEQKKAIVKFFDGKGNHLKNLRVPNAQTVTDISWEGTGLRVAIAAGANIFCAAIRPNYKWCYLSNGTLVFAFQKSDRVQFCVVFWDTKSDQKYMKYVKQLTQIKGQGEFCAIFTKNEFQVTQIDLCNSIGTIIQSKQVALDSNIYGMSKTHIIVCSEHYIYMWQYKSQTSRLTMFEPSTQTGYRKIGREICWFIDDKPDLSTIYDLDVFDNSKESEDPICGVAVSEQLLIIGRESGVLRRFTLPHITEETKLFWKALPMLIDINCDGTRLALIDISGVLNILEINAQGGNVFEFEKKQCWAIKWSQDHPHQLAFMQKSKLTTVTNVTVGPQIATDGYICSFSGLKVVYCYLDDIMLSPDENLKFQELFNQHQSSALEKFNDLLKKQGMAKAVQFVDENPHPSLWKIVAQKALMDLDYLTAEKALIKIDDYKTLKYVKKIQQLDDREKQKAEVLILYGKYDAAENIYRNLERKDLAINMRVRVGDWFRVLEMVRQGSGYDETLNKMTNQLGNYYAERLQWDKAAQFYITAKNYKGLIECFTMIEDYDSLAQIIDEIPENDPILNELADRFQLAGMAEYAVKCYERMGEHKKAVDCCVLLNHWNIAIQMAEKHGYMQVEGLLHQNANELLNKNKRLEAAQLYRKANRNTEAAKILSGIADQLIDRDSKPLYIKKLYVMAALEVDLYKKRLVDATMTGQNGSTTKTLDSLITSDINTSSEKILNNPWRGAEAWHYYILCQRQLYAGQFKSALKTALRLTDYELDMDPRKIYTIVALAAYYNKSYKQCSRAFVKLEGMGTPQERQKYIDIAVSIFTKHPPKQSPGQMIKCPGKNCKDSVSEYDTTCRSCGSNFPACVVSGKPITTRNYYRCKACRHKMYESEVEKADLKFCALCHTQIDFRKFGQRNDDD